MDPEILKRAEIFETLEASQTARLLAVARPHRLERGECLFLLGDHADRLYVVLSGKMELSFPLMFGSAVREVAVETKSPVSVLGWSAFVKPYRFTLSARAVEPTELAGFPRNELQMVFESDPRIGYAFTRHVSEVVGRRLLQVQALWARELQRTVTSYMRDPGQAPPDPSPPSPQGR